MAYLKEDIVSLQERVGLLQEFAKRVETYLARSLKIGRPVGRRRWVGLKSVFISVLLGEDVDDALLPRGGKH